MNRITGPLALSIAACASTLALGAEVGPIVITEIMYNPHGADEGQEWVEIYNPTALPVDLSGWYLENSDGTTTPFDPGTTLASHAAAIIAPRRGGVDGGGTSRRSTYVNSQASWNTAWGPGIQVIFVESFWNYPGDPIPITSTLAGLTNSPNGGSDAIELRSALGEIVDSVWYFDDESVKTPWPDDNDGGSIQLLRDLSSSFLDNNHGAAWRLSEPADALGSRLALTALPAFPGIVSAGTPGRLPNTVFTDCDSNSVHDAVDIVLGTALDAYPHNNIPDACEGDCNANLVGDLTDIALDWRVDRNLNARPDSCDINSSGGAGGVGGTLDINRNGILDSFENKPNIVITEIMYNPAGTDDGKEFVEIFNAGTTSVNIAGWSLKDIEGDPATGTIPAGTLMLPGEIILLTSGSGPGVPADVLAQFRAAWNIPVAVRTFALSPWQDRAQQATSIEEVLALLDASGHPVDVVNYENPQFTPLSAWPGPDGTSSITLLSTSLTKSANDTGSNWRLSMPNLDGAYDSVQSAHFSDIRLTGSAGSPGVVWRQPPQSPTGEAVFTEVMYNPNSSAPVMPRNEWLEIYNPGPGVLDVSGWYLRDDDGRTGAIPPATTLGAGEVMVLIPRGSTPTRAVAEGDFRAAWGDVCHVIALSGWSDLEPVPNMGSLSNSPGVGTEILTLRRADGNVVDILDYDDDGVSWPVDAASASPGLGTAWSIALRAGHYSAPDNNIGINWGASVQGIDLANLNTMTPVFNGFDIASPGLLPGVVLTPTCAPTPCPADFNADGSVDFFDYDDFVSCFEGLACPPGRTADFDLDGSIDFFDYDSFVIAFESAC
jgi:hypothetical protein